MKALYSFKRLLVVLFVVALASSAILIHYNKTSTYSNEYIAYAEAQIASKQEFARTHQNLNRGINIDPDIAREMFNAIMSDDTLSRAEKEVQINEIGYYTYQEAKPLASGTQDVNFYSVDIIYNPSKATWLLRNAISWKDGADKNREHPTVVIPMTGDQYNVGSENYAGILLTDTYGNSNGLSIVSTSQEYVGYEHVTNNSPNRFPGVSGANGALFKYQDKIRIMDVGFLGLSYHYMFNDYTIINQMEYSYEFSNFHGNAVAAYGNTWDSSSLNSIGFGLDGSISFSWSSTSGHWDVISPTDKPF